MDRPLINIAENKRAWSPGVGFLTHPYINEYMVKRKWIPNKAKKNGGFLQWSFLLVLFLFEDYVIVIFPELYFVLLSCNMVFV